MDVAKAAPRGFDLPNPSDGKIRDQATQNAVTSFQAKYGEHPKEARTVKKALDKDDFMRIMITEMKHQDPTKPMDSDRMATQMAQVTSVEQLKNVSNAIEKLSDKNSATDRLAMSAMIGKTVTLDKSRFTHQKGTLSPVNFELPENADKVKLTVMNEKGEEIATRELEPMKAGMNVYNWNGINASSIQSNSGTYMVRVDAENAKGNKIKIDPVSQESVMGVSFEGGETNFLVGDAKNPQKVAFKNVIRIEGDSKLKTTADQSHAARAVAAQHEAAGGGGAVASGMQLPPGLQEKVKAEMAKATLKPGVESAQVVENNAEASSDAVVKAEGFPNGLGD